MSAMPIASHLAAEIVSESDRTFVEAKRDLYPRHEACKCVLIVQQDRLEVRVDLRTAAGWTEQVLTKPDDPLDLSDFGLHCKVGDLYRGTALQARQKPKR